MESWRGFLMGLIDRFRIVTDAEPTIDAERSALESLRRNERHFSNEKLTIDELHRMFAKTADAISVAHQSQQEEFRLLLETSEKSSADALAKHEAEMKGLSDRFREKMKLRAPVEYWDSKAQTHEVKARTLMRWMFGLLAARALTVADFERHCVAVEERLVRLMSLPFEFEACTLGQVLDARLHILAADHLELGFVLGRPNEEKILGVLVFFSHLGLLALYRGHH